MNPDTAESWRELAAQAATERDSDKLLQIIQKLNDALDLRDRRARNLFRHSGRKVLFVDDEESIRLTLPMVLRKRGFEVLVAASVQEAKDLLRAHEFDVLLCDLNIESERDGFNVLTAMREINPLCIAVFITAYADFETAHCAIQHDIDGYVTKPADIEELIALMERKLAGPSGRTDAVP